MSAAGRDAARRPPPNAARSPVSPAAVLRAGCKVNLYLRITGVRPDGYHELDTLFLPLPDPCDLLYVTPHAAPGIAFTCTEPDVNPSRNTVVAAYEGFAAATGFRPGLAVHLEKHIPHGAGLGGGSADAAVLLRHLAALCARQVPHLAPTPGALRAVAAKVGADVPFFLMNVPARAVGIGDTLTPLAPETLAALGLTGLHLVLACPQLRISTPWAYRAWDAAGHAPAGQGPAGHDAKSQRRCLTSHRPEDKSPLSHGPWLTNSFETVVFRTHATLRRTKEFLLRRGACAALLSGSGASLFALFRQHDTACDVADALRSENIAAFVHAL